MGDGDTTYALTSDEVVVHGRIKKNEIINNDNEIDTDDDDDDDNDDGASNETERAWFNFFIFVNKASTNVELIKWLILNVYIWMSTDRFWIRFNVCCRVEMLILLLSLENE